MTHPSEIQRRNREAELLFVGCTIVGATYVPALEGGQPPVFVIALDNGLTLVPYADATCKAPGALGWAVPGMASKAGCFPPLAESQVTDADLNDVTIEGG